MSIETLFSNSSIIPKIFSACFRFSKSLLVCVCYNTSIRESHETQIATETGEEKRKQT